MPMHEGGYRTAMRMYRPRAVMLWTAPTCCAPHTVGLQGRQCVEHVGLGNRQNVICVPHFPQDLSAACQT